MTKKIILLFLLLRMGVAGQTYTINFQPTGGSGIDANVESNNPTTNYSTDDNIRFSRNTSGAKERSFLKFDLSSLSPGVDIISAKLVLYGIAHTTVNAGNGILQLVPDPWTASTVNWNISILEKSADMTTLSISSPTSSTQNYTLDVTTMVQTMVNTPLINYGWLLAMGDESNVNNKTFKFGSSDNVNTSLCPQLVITYCNHLTVNAFVSPATSTTATNAGVFVDVANGVPPYTYSWSNGSSTKDIYNIAPGLYTVTVTDSRGYADSRIIPVSGSCGTLSFTVLYAPGSFGNARLISQSFDNNPGNSNYAGTSNLSAQNVPSGSGNSVTRNLFAFNMDMLPNNIQVSSAILTLSNTAGVQPASFKLQLCRAANTWNQRTVTYNNQPAFIDSVSDVIEFDYDGTNPSYNIVVSAHIQKMLTLGNSSSGWVLKVKDETVPGSGTTASFNNPHMALQLIMPTFACDDNTMNWNQEDTYDENGNVIASEKTYLDNMGRLTQKLVQNAAGDVFRTQTVYDSYGFAAVNSLPAYSGSQLTYQTNFMLNHVGYAYNYQDFDTPGKLNNNSSIQNGISNSLGNYYSDLNPYDSRQATAVNPYSRVETTGAGSKTRVSKPGNAYTMGSGHESITFSMISGDELRYFFGTSGANYYSYKAVQSSTNNLDGSPLSVNAPIIASKQIVITPDNPETITYRVGDKVIATCYNGVSSAETYTNMTSITNYMSYAGTKCTDIHLPYANITSLSLPLPIATGSNPATADIAYSITDLYTDIVLAAGTDYTIGSSRSVTFSTTFLAQYTNRSLCLRISYLYSAPYENYMAAHTYTPSDAQAVYTLSYGRASTNYYDLGGALRKSVSPKGFNISTPTTASMATTYDYSHYGQVIATKSPDEGLVQMVYNREGRLRFSQNDVQSPANYFSYINYDKHGRPYETGEIHTAGSNSTSVSFMNYYGLGTQISPGVPSSYVVDSQDGLAPSEKTNSTVACYTVPASADDIPSAYSFYSQYRNFRNGPVNYIKNANSSVWYNYDKLDRGLAMISQVTETVFTTHNTNVNDQIKTSETSINYFTGLPDSSMYQKNNSNEYLSYRYSYDVNYRPTTTQLHYGGNTYSLSTNSYNKMGGLKRVVIGNNYQGLDYVYTLNGGLKAINHPGLDATLDPGSDNGDYSGNSTGVNKDLFGEIIEYYNNDYQRSGTTINCSIGSTTSFYDGLIYATRFKTQNVVNTTTTGASYINYPSSTATLITNTNYNQQELRFDYTYDQFNQLATTIFGTYNNSSNSITAQYVSYSESGPSGSAISYDRNGNITRLVRKADGTTTFDDLTYTYGANDNKLATILDAASNSYPSSVNFKTPSTSSASGFSYNAIGQMTASPSETIDLVEYFPDGKIKKISNFTTGNSTTYAYGPMGEKLLSDNLNFLATQHRYTWYIGPYIYELDQAGSATFTIKEAKVSTGVIRVPSGASVNTGYLVYQVSDHLGNVRASFTARTPSLNTNGTGIEILSYNDYYAFGGQLPGRSYSAENYRYAFQGQEKSQDGTIWDQFELRQYNHDLGRWFSPDPYGQFSSPYIAMANNPVSTTDPDGGYTKIGTYGTESYGEVKDRIDRLNHIGDYSYENSQKNYDSDVAELRKKYLLGGDDGDMPRDVSGFLDALSSTNNWYMGLSSNSPINYQNESTYLSQSELSLHSATVVDITAAGKMADAGVGVGDLESRLITDTGNGTEEYAKEKRDNNSASARNSEAVGSKYATTIIAGGDQMITTEYKPDGSEVHTYYDLEGNVTNVGYRSTSYVQDYNSRMAGTSFETTQYLNSGSSVQSDKPTPENGGIINNAKDFTAFMKDQAVNNPVEVSAWGLKDGSYIVQPWIENEAKSSHNNRHIVEKFGYTIDDINSNNHSHPDANGPSYQDAINSSLWGVPVNVFNKSGETWQVSYPRSINPEFTIPYYGYGQNYYYGKLIQQ
jgi:RHS repeat-associated protein